METIWQALPGILRERYVARKGACFDRAVISQERAPNLLTGAQLRS